jgi:hypothetical protein
MKDIETLKKISALLKNLDHQELEIIRDVTYELKWNIEKNSKVIVNKLLKGE